MPRCTLIQIFMICKYMCIQNIFELSIYILVREVVIRPAILKIHKATFSYGPRHEKTCLSRFRSKRVSNRSPQLQRLA